MRGWVFVPAGFGLWWIMSGLAALSALNKTSSGILIGVALLVVLVGLRSKSAKHSFDRRTFLLASIGEGIGIASVLVISAVSHKPSLIMPLIGAVVGLHFIPLAKAFADRAFITAGCLLTVVSLLALLWSSPLREAVAGLGGGSVLWGFSLLASLTNRSQTNL